MWFCVWFMSMAFANSATGNVVVQGTHKLLMLFFHLHDLQTVTRSCCASILAL